MRETLRREKDGNVMLSLLYEDGKAYFYSKDKDGNVVKGDKWEGTDDFIAQTVNDFNTVSSTKHGKTVVNDLQSSKYGYNISEASRLDKSGFDGKDGAKGGGEISYYQKGGPHANASTNKSPVVLGHELFHAWSFEFTNTTKGMNYGQRLLRETMAVEFENYLRASFGEKEMRTHYRIEGNNERVASSSINDALNYKLPSANYLLKIPLIQERKFYQPVDGTYVPQTIRTMTIDTRKQKILI